VQALLLLAVVPAYGYFASKATRSRLITWVTLFFVSNLVLFYFLGAAGLHVGIAFFLWVGIFNVVVTAQFWAYANDLYDEESGKRIFPIIGIGSSLGAWAGARLAARLFAAFDAYHLMLVGAAGLLLSIVLVRLVDARRGSNPVGQQQQPPASTKGGFGLVLSNRYLLLIALMVLMFNLVNSLGEYVLGQMVVSEAKAAVASGTITSAQLKAHIGSFYGSFYSWVNLLGLFLQVFVVSRLFKYVGVRGALFVLPLIALGSYSLMALLPVLGIVQIAKVLENSTDYSIQNTARHALFLPTTREAKYKAKAAIDTFFWRVGDMLQAGFVLVGTGAGVCHKALCLAEHLAGLCVAGADRRYLSRTSKNHFKELAVMKVCVPKTASDTSTGHFGLPNDMVDRAITRLGWLGLAYAATINLVHFTRMYALPQHAFAGWTMPPLVYACLIAGTAAGLAITALAWSRRVQTSTMLDLGLIFEVVAAFCLAAMENSSPLIGQGWVRGISGLALWIVFFALVVPGSLGKMALATVAAAGMGPLTLMMYTGFYSRPLPEAGIWLSLFVPDVLCAVWAVILSRFIYGMGHDLGKARRMGYYELIEPLGKGGMGEVWRAKHRMLARPAAIKLISPEAAGVRGGMTTTLIKRFEQEAQLTANLQSQHTIQLYDFGVTDDGSFYYVMEYLNGLDLESLVEKYGPVPGRARSPLHAAGQRLARGGTSRRARAS
jgi:AAA family ATP:ADP antiporter